MFGVGGLGNVTKIPELKKRILFVVGMLAVYRLGVFVPTPGIDVAKLRSMFDTGAGTLFGFVNMFSGGALENFSIFTLGLAPYISVSIIVQILAATYPSLQALKKEGEAGQRVLTRYTRRFTILLALIQGTMIAYGLQNQGLVRVPGTLFIVCTAITLTGGTAFLMWLGEQISERGIGNGTSLLIFAGIVARMPSVLVDTLVQAQEGDLHPATVFVLITLAVLTVAAIVFVESSQRRIPVQYPRRMVGKHLAQAQTQYMPLKLNMAGVIPPILASALLVVPGTLGSLTSNELVREYLAYLQPGTWVYTGVFVVFIFFFCYWYTAVIFNPTEIAENLKKHGGFIPTVRPGKETSDYLYSVLNRLTLWGALYISLVCLLPQHLYLELGAGSFAYVFGGTAILIAVGVTLDTANQIQSHLVAKNYEAFMSRSSKMRGGLSAVSQTRSRILRR